MKQACLRGVTRAVRLWMLGVFGYALMSGLLHAMMTWLPALFPPGAVLSLPW